MQNLESPGRRGGGSAGRRVAVSAAGQEGGCETNAVRPRAFELTNMETRRSVNTAAKALVSSAASPASSARQPPSPRFHSFALRQARH